MKKAKNHFSLSLRVFLTVCCLIFATAIFAQNVTVKGTITDASGDPVIGATVKQLGSTNGVITDVDGNYTISVPSSSKLEVSYIGYKTQVVSVSARPVSRCSLKRNPRLLMK